MRRLERCIAGAGALALALLAVPPALAASEKKSAAGAEISQVIIATAGALVLTAGMLVLVAGHRTGRVPVFGRLAGVAEKVSGLRGWAALPGTFLIGALMIAVFGMYWDVAIHLDKGRDAGPLANPAHYFILLGLFGVLFAGVMAMALPLKEAGRAQVTLPNRWKVPVGALLITACGAFSLSAFPLDDVWHRLFGQDVTLWGPTHLMLIGGASLSVIGAWVLHVEGLGGRLTRDVDGLPRWTRIREVFLAGALLVGMSTFQDEFDMGVPQFRLVLHPILLMLAAGFVLVAARIRLGRGGAIGAVAVFLSVRLVLAVLVGGVFDRTVPHVPPYIAEALVVELIALRFAAEQKPIQFGALAGLGIGTVGLAAEWGWSHVWTVIPWPSALFPEGALLGLVMAVAAGVLGGFLGRTLTPTVPRAPALAPRWAVPAAAAVAAGVLVFAVPMTESSEPIRATVTTRDVTPPPNREIAATVRLDPADAADDAEWLNVTGWQGGSSVIDPLRRTGPGTYEATKPIPVTGNWKTTLRLHRGREVLGLPIFLPEDRAIPAKEIPAGPSFTREFVFDKENLQREQKDDVPGSLTTAAYLIVLALGLALVAAIVVGLRRLERAHGGAPGGPLQPADARAPVPPRPAPAS
jgi:hypothetical protein